MLYNNRATDQKRPRPKCDMCPDNAQSPAQPAAVDGKTDFGPWAYMCLDHHDKHGRGLGMGVGQVLLCDDDLDDKLIEHYSLNKTLNERARGGGSHGIPNGPGDGHYGNADRPFGDANQSLIDDGSVEF